MSHHVGYWSIKFLNSVKMTTTLSLLDDIAEVIDGRLKG